MDARREDILVAKAYNIANDFWDDEELKFVIKELKWWLKERKRQLKEQEKELKKISKNRLNS